jgi:DNA polymerase-3 subunit epsilon
MGFLDRLFGNRATPRATGSDEGLRWVVLDVETSGLDTGSDRLLAIGAVAVHGERIVVEDSFELVVQQARASERQNILVHGIGAHAQVNGIEPRQACTRFLDYARSAPLVAFHASFDRGFLARAMKAYLGLPMKNDWLDLADLAPALHPDVKGKALDDWLAHFGITVDQRHHAASDAFATAALFIRLLSGVPPEQRGLRRLQKLAAQARWLGQQ